MFFFALFRFLNDDLLSFQKRAMLTLTEVVVPSEAVRVAQPQVQAYFETQLIGDGTLIVAESCVVWKAANSSNGFRLPYPSIIVHAVSVDLSSFPHEHILVLIDANKAGSARRRRPRNQPIPLFTEEEARHIRDLNVHEAEMNGDAEESGDDAGSEGTSYTIRFVPTDRSVLNTIYKEMSECQALNPDEEDEISDEEEGEGAVIEEEGPDMEAGGQGWYTADNVSELENKKER
ncbi:hypothetical protein WR25_26058 [Diploscapter pachys]|uniref:Methylosome subunit pICln n=1 Tax=Diploscapter pachys TaxID=2018661 RepID=A0A2A2K7D9_9BILA|nr:hypothetical protein WR25_26058 [Diploscapter pachys]